MSTILDALAGRVCLNVEQLARAADLSESVTRRQLAAAYHAHLVERRDQGCYVLTPQGRRTQKKGKPLPELARIAFPAALPNPNGVRERLWAAMRTLGKFASGDLVELAYVDGETTRRLEVNARAYIAALFRAGYLTPLPGKVRTKPNSPGQKRWRLIRDTGLLAPRLCRRRRVFDQNLSVFVETGAPSGEGVP